MLLHAYMSLLKPVSAAHMQRSFCYAIITMHVMSDCSQAQSVPIAAFVTASADAQVS